MAGTQSRSASVISSSTHAKGRPILFRDDQQLPRRNGHEHEGEDAPDASPGLVGRGISTIPCLADGARCTARSKLAVTMAIAVRA